MKTMKVNASVNMDKRNIAVGFTAEKEEGESDFFDSLFKDKEIDDVLADEDDLDDIDE